MLQFLQCKQQKQQTGKIRSHILTSRNKKAQWAFSPADLTHLSPRLTIPYFYVECHWTFSHARLICFVLETNQHFVGSARIAGLYFILLNKINSNVEIYTKYILLGLDLEYHKWP